MAMLLTRVRRRGTAAAVAGAARDMRLRHVITRRRMRRGGHLLLLRTYALPSRGGRAALCPRFVPIGCGHGSGPLPFCRASLHGRVPTTRWLVPVRRFDLGSMLRAARSSPATPPCTRWLDAGPSNETAIGRPCLVSK